MCFDEFSKKVKLSYMKLYSSKWIRSVTMAGALAGIFSACNKELPDAEPIIPSSPAGLSIFETVRANGNIYSYLDSAIVRASTFNNPAGKLDTLLKNKSNVLTFFAPDNDAFQRSFQLLGLPTEISTIKFFRPGQLDTILRYHLLAVRKSQPQVYPPRFLTAFIYKACLFCSHRLQLCLRVI